MRKTDPMHAPRWQEVELALTTTAPLADGYRVRLVPSCTPGLPIHVWESRHRIPELWDSGPT